LEADAGDFDLAVQAILHEIMVENGRVIFDGDGYADAWQKEAAARGLPNFKTTVDALPASGDAVAIALYGKYGVMNEREVCSRLGVYWEQYIMAIKVEAKLMVEMAKTMIYPTAMRYQTELAAAAAAVCAAGLEADTDILAMLLDETKWLKESMVALENSLDYHDDDLAVEAGYMGRVVVPAMTAVRVHADALESIVADDLWPLPTYQEMMFIR
jgi:glutamine synthetase